MAVPIHVRSTLALLAKKSTHFLSAASPSVLLCSDFSSKLLLFEHFFERGQ